MEDVGNTTSYQPINDLPSNTEIYVCIIPYNNGNQLPQCSYQYFRTEVFIPSCTTLSNPLNGSENVPLDSVIEWNNIAEANGYFITIGTTSGGNEIVGNIYIEDENKYELVEELPTNTEIYVSVIPVNTTGEAIGCLEESFTTELITKVKVPKFFTPNGDGRYDNWIINNSNGIIENIQIFDRYGKVFYNKSNESTFIWNGLLGNKLLIETDYWYKITFIDGSVQRGHFSLIYE
jgi:gliding motility-associated-like protein